MEGVCSAQVQAQNKHSRGSALALQAAFADINIHKSRSVYYWFSQNMTKSPTPTARSGQETPAKRPHHEALETAFVQLSFAMKLWHFVRSGRLPRESFDIELTAVDDAGVPYVMREGEFQSDDDLVLAAENNISICFGVAAITLWEAIREHSGLESKQLNRQHRILKDWRAWYLQFAVVLPMGQQRRGGNSPPKTSFAMSSEASSSDLTSAHGLPFDYSYIGAPDGLRQLRRLAESAGLV